uniref:uncharacterized protein LOC108949623 isoform X15 n=1 Tax=Ciona intestinalis TaxID=7719 RepID=UPI000EF4DB60|nr:uncharacterized protein LOC108949623 isoform X15 [Ciona intestinalis]|eukprot:XP_026690944.1 uncharacterized protein LOC108949623 isoform X15 [Ciona intestinalis]
MIRFHLVLFAMVLLCLAVGSRGFRYRRTELTPGRRYSSPWSFFGSTRRRTAFTTRRRYSSPWSSFSSTRRRTLVTTRRRYSFSSSRRRFVFTTKYRPAFSTRTVPFPTTYSTTYYSTWFNTSTTPFPTTQPLNSRYTKIGDLTSALRVKALRVGYRTNVKPPTSLYKYV